MTLEGTPPARCGLLPEGIGGGAPAWAPWLHSGQQRGFPDHALLPQDLGHAIEELAAFLGCALRPEEVSAIQQHSSFPAMQENTMVNYTLVSCDILDHSKGQFMRKGRSDGSRDGGLSSPQITPPASPALLAVPRVCPAMPPRGRRGGSCGQDSLSSAPVPSGQAACTQEASRASPIPCGRPPSPPPLPSLAGIVGDWRDHFTPLQDALFNRVYKEKMRHSSLRLHWPLA